MKMRFATVEMELDLFLAQFMPESRRSLPRTPVMSRKKLLGSGNDACDEIVRLIFIVLLLHDSNVGRIVQASQCTPQVQSSDG